MSLSSTITDVCRRYFGRVAIVRGKRQLVDNRCDACPLRTPCLAWGGRPARTFDELRESNERFEIEARKIVEAGP